MEQSEREVEAQQKSQSVAFRSYEAIKPGFISIPYRLHEQAFRERRRETESAA